MENEELRTFINNIRKFMKGEEEPEYETNQGDLGIKWIFRGIVVNAQFGVNFSITKYAEYNKIII